MQNLICKDVYLISLVFLVETFIQWMWLDYLNSNRFFDDSSGYLLIFMVALTLIMWQRFFDYCLLKPVWVQAFVAFCLVEFVIIGSKSAISATTIEVTVHILAVLLQVMVFTLIGGYMAKTNTIVFVGLMCLCVFIYLASCVMALTIMLSIQWKVTYAKVFILIAYPAILFSISYDSRIMNTSSEDNTIGLSDCIRYGLFLYSEVILLLVLMLNLVK